MAGDIGWGPAWPAKVERRIARWLDAGLGPTWVVAVSGGSDSVALLRLLHGAALRLGLTLSVAHLDHGTRGAAARDDAAFVADLAAFLGLPFDLGRWEPVRPGHFEADARRARLAWLLETARARGAAAVALGHTRDDQAETVLHRIVRGTGLRGLAGIPARRTLGEGVTLVRPLLRVARVDLRAFLETLGQPFRDDASNRDVARTRARIRHDLLPKLGAEYNPDVAAALARLARLADASTRALDEHVADLERVGIIASRDPEFLIVKTDVAAGWSSHVRAEVVRRAWRRAGWPEGSMSEPRWRRLAALCGRHEGARVDVGAGITAEYGPAGLILRPRAEAEDRPILPEPAPLAVPGSAGFGAGRVVTTLDPTDPRDETIDLDRLSPPLFVRGPRPGDRFGPLGMATGSQPLNDFFRARKLPRAARIQTPLVCDAQGVVWVVGHRIADRVKLGPATTRVIGLRWEPG